jgi:hypothetical protein
MTHDNKSKVYTDPIGVKNRLCPLRCPQRNLEFLVHHINSQLNGSITNRVNLLLYIHHYTCDIMNIYVIEI